MKNKKRSLLLTVVLALLTTAIAYMYITQAVAASKEIPPVEMAEVVVPLNTIPAHVKVTEEMVEVRSIPKESLHEQAVTSVEQIANATTKSELFTGEQILVERLVLNEMEATLSYRIPESMRALTIPTTEVSGIGGHLASGDHVDVLVTYNQEEGEESKVVTYTQLQNIEVLTMGPNSVSTEEATGGVPSSITILVTPQQAEVVAYATLNGSFHMTLRNPADNQKVETGTYGTPNFDNWKER